MTKTEILNTLARDYVAAHRVYASMEKQAAEFLRQNKMEAYRQEIHKAAFRSATLYGIKRAAMALGITGTEFTDAVDQLLNK